MNKDRETCNNWQPHDIWTSLKAELEQENMTEVAK